MSMLAKIISIFDRRKITNGDLLSKINQQLVFKQSAALSLGVECEFGIVSGDHYEPSALALDIVKKLNDPFVHLELYQHMIEMTSGVATNVLEIENDLKPRLSSIQAAVAEKGSCLLAAGSLPLLRLEQTTPVETERYGYLRERRKALYERFTTLGMHIHLGMTDTSSCIRFHNFYMHFLPHFLALSANSPFEEGRDTGFASIRPSVTESMPIGGLPYQFKTWQDYKDLCRAMARADSITDLKDLWWDLRPSPRFGTLEIRICDQPSTLAEVLAISAFIHCLGHWFAEHHTWLEEMPRPNGWRMRENKWRTMRYGLDAEIVLNDNGDKRSLKEDITLWLQRLKPFYDRLGYASYLSVLQDMLEKGNGADRQRRVWEATKDLKAVCAHLADEIQHGKPLWDKVEALEKQALKEMDPDDYSMFPLTGITPA